MYGRSPGIHNHETLWEPESRWSRYDAPRYGKHDDVPCGHCHPGCIDWRWPRPDSLLVESLEPALERGTFGPREKPTRRRTEPAVEQKFLFRSPQEASTELCVPSPPLRVRVGRFGCDDLQVSPPASKQPLLVPLKIPEVVFTYPSDVRHRKMMCDKGYKILTNLSRNTRTRPRPSPLANKTHGEFWKDGWLVQPRAASVRTAVLRDPAMHTRTFEPEPESQPPSNPQPLPKSQPLPAFNPPPALQPQPRRNIRRFVSFDLDDPSPREQQGSGLSSMNPVQRGLQETPPAPAPPAVASLMSEKPKLSPPSTPRTEVFFTMTSLGQRSAQDSTLMHSEAPAAVKEPKPVKPV
ncbi:MAG: uncharacterized protein KVP18_004817 [Porospora cf. gigantea A]|uniref:uncharacterized protein n=1 Tax=Porospora cf. gigantea A TaxID=2853593 RepID=UPI00355A3096|nr:MAG: hypothetical protein KVP18_004817 [Porospora cf. gigantea A]